MVRYYYWLIKIVVLEYSNSFKLQSQVTPVIGITTNIRRCKPVVRVEVQPWTQKNCVGHPKRSSQKLLDYPFLQGPGRTYKIYPKNKKG